MTVVISDIKAAECIDSRGFPTVQAQVTLSDGSIGFAMVPSGASTGEHEALELRDGDKKRFQGKGVLKAVSHVNNEIASALKGTTLLSQRRLDETILSLDGSKNKDKLGANALLSVSLSYAKALAVHQKKPFYASITDNSSFTLPAPLINVINGGAHADNPIDFQEFMIVPHMNSSFSENLRAACEVFQVLKKILKGKGLSTAVGDEGGFAPALPSIENTLSTLCDSISEAGYTPGKDIALALDVAASELWDKEAKKYVFKKSSKESFSSADMISLYASLTKKFPIVSIEDGLDENDWDGWKSLTTSLGNSCQLVGDDLFVTNTERLKKGIDEKCGNSILIKLNQIGTLTETLDAIAMATSAGMTSIISHRSGETEDTTIADLCVATSAGQIKTGSVCRAERTAKYNRLLYIETELGNKTKFASPFKI